MEEYIHRPPPFINRHFLVFIEFGYYDNVRIINNIVFMVEVSLECSTPIEIN